MRILFLDDDERRHEEFRKHAAGHYVLHVYTAAAAIKSLTLEPRFDVASLDHDLELLHYGKDADGYGTGMEVAEFIRIMPRDLRPGLVVIHSWNPGGSQRMARALRFSGAEILREEFGGWWPPAIADRRRVA
jgi:hypothetical protein